MSFFESKYGKDHTVEAAQARKQEYQEARKRRALERVRLEKEIVAQGRSGRVRDLISRLGGDNPGTNTETFCRFCQSEKEDVLMGVCPECATPRKSTA